MQHISIQYLLLYDWCVCGGYVTVPLHYVYWLSLTVRWRFTCRLLYASHARCSTYAKHYYVRILLFWLQLANFHCHMGIIHMKVMCELLYTYLRYTFCVSSQADRCRHATHIYCAIRTYSYILYEFSCTWIVSK